MSELLREVAHHLLHAASHNGAPDSCAAVVIIIDCDGAAGSLFVGDENAAGIAAHALPGIAADFVGQICEGMGFAVPGTELSTGDGMYPDLDGSATLSRPADLILAERITAQVISKARA